jgi:hypothetical protein
MQAKNQLSRSRIRVEVPDTCLFKGSTLTRRHPHTLGPWPMGSHGRSASLQRLFHIKFFDLAVSFSPLPKGGSFHKVPCPSISSPGAASQDWIITVAWRSAFWTLSVTGLDF